MSAAEFFGTLPVMDANEILKHINAKLFFETYLPHIKNYKHKMRKIDGNKKPIDFSEPEKKEIIKAVNQMFKDLKKK